jgi:hypothetical protein
MPQGFQYALSMFVRVLFVCKRVYGYAFWSGAMSVYVGVYVCMGLEGMLEGDFRAAHLFLGIVSVWKGQF